jgi:hypothetical protein
MEYVEAEVTVMDCKEAKDLVSEYHVCSIHLSFTRLMNKYRTIVKRNITQVEEQNMDLDDIDFNQLEQSTKQQ